MSVEVLGQQAQVTVLAERISAKIAHRPPGWRLPRSSVLARHYGVPQQLLDEALAGLLARHQISYLGPGQFSRANGGSEAPAAAGGGLAIRIEPVCPDISCQSRQDSYGPLPAGLTGALGLAAGVQALTIQVLWAAGPAPAALVTSYLPGGRSAQAAACQGAAAPADPPAAWPAHLLVTGHRPAGECRPHAIALQMSAASAAVARKLRLAAGTPVALVLASYLDPADGSVRCVTVAALRPERFLIVIESAGSPAGGCADAAAWQRALADQPG